MNFILRLRLNLETVVHPVTPGIQGVKIMNATMCLQNKTVPPLPPRAALCLNGVYNADHTSAAPVCSETRQEANSFDMVRRRINRKSLERMYNSRRVQIA